MGGKQADRKAKKANEKEEPQEAAAAGDGKARLLAMTKNLMLGSCLVETLPKLPNLLQDKEVPAEKKEEPKEAAEGDAAEGEKKEEPKEELVGADAIFESLQKRLVWHNCLGLAEPATAEDSLAGFIALKEMEIDMGPKAKRNANPALDRILVNVHDCLPQYMHILLALMVVRAFLFRSFFACLPWLVGYQVASLLVPLEQLRDKIFDTIKQPIPPQIAGPCPIKFRVAATMALHALLWFFFMYEFWWKAMFYEKIPLLGLIAFHAYAARPIEP